MWRLRTNVQPSALHQSVHFIILFPASYGPREMIRHDLWFRDFLLVFCSFTIFFHFTYVHYVFLPTDYLFFISSKFKHWNFLILFLKVTGLSFLYSRCLFLLITSIIVPMFFQYDQIFFSLIVAESFVASNPSFSDSIRKFEVSR